MNNPKSARPSLATPRKMKSARPSNKPKTKVASLLKSTKKPTTVKEYFDSTPLPARRKLKEMQKCIRSAAPKAVESPKWGSLAFSYDRILVIYAAFKNHIGFYLTPSVLKAFADEISAYKTGKGSIQFPLDKPLPLTLIKKMTQLRVRESQKNDVKWK